MIVCNMELRDSAVIGFAVYNLSGPKNIVRITEVSAIRGVF